jgi:hypothetical protein
MAQMIAKRAAETLLLVAALCIATAQTRAATDLKLAPELSFTDDSSSNFPIAGKALGDGAIAQDRATILFFGTAHCWNTNREAERLVTLYPKYRDQIDFVIVDVDHLSSAQRELAARYYRGYIPTITVIDSDGKVIYNRAGETGSSRGDTSKLEALLNSAK